MGAALILAPARLPMSPTAEQIAAFAMKLPASERAKLADQLFDSLDAVRDDHDPDPEITALWLAEARRRLAELESGAVAAIPAEAVFAQARKNRLP